MTDIIWDTRDTVVNKTDRISAFMEFIVGRRMLIKSIGVCDKMLKCQKNLQQAEGPDEEGL